MIHVDVGRPISDINAKIIYQCLYDDAEDVLSTLKQKEIEIQSNDNKWCSMRILPYRTIENMIDGVVITFVDITKAKHIDSELRKSHELLRAVLNQRQMLLQEDCEL